MRQAPGNEVLDSVADLVLGSVEGFGRFLPGKAPRPATQKQHVGLGEVMLAVAPGNFFDSHAATAAVDPPHGIQEEDQKASERNELEPLGGKLIVTRGTLVTA
jgi:hypothetical protein